MKKERGIEEFLADTLPRVSKPGRYIGGEVNSVSGPPGEGDIRIALAFPEVYEIGMSHKGLSIIYSVLNSINGVYAERVFAPWPDMEAKMKERHVELFSLETKTPLSDFDIIGFSLMFELTYTNVVNMLILSGIPPMSVDRRDSSFPLIIAGGAQSMNPEPVAEIFDAVVVGDGEEALLDIVEASKRVGFGGAVRDRLLSLLGEIEGVYVPRFFEPKYKKSKEKGAEIGSEEDEIFSGMVFTAGKGEEVAVNGEGAEDHRVKRRILKDINSAPSLKYFNNLPVVPNVKAVHDRVSVEIARGCGRGCRFCQAGYVNRPVRERSVDNVLAIATKALAFTGMSDVSLLSLSATDHSNIASMMKNLMKALTEEVGERRVALSVPSVRVDTLTEDIIEEIKKVRKTGFTIAPEAGSQRLRDVINKNITEDEIEQTVDRVFSAGWKLIKLYFMIGLPTETDEDIEALIDLVRKIARRLKGRGLKGGNINVAVSTFIPKPHTPFQWEPFIGVEEIKRKQAMIRSALFREKIKLKFHDPRMSLVEAVFARGNRRLVNVVLRASELGACFDGWTEHFDFGLWERAFSDLGLDVNELAGLVPDRANPLPWDHIDSGVDREFLLDEFEMAHSTDSIITTPDCVRGGCTNCGVCGDGISNVLGEEATAVSVKTPVPELDSPVQEQYQDKEILRLKYLLFYSRSGNLRFLSHLETASVIVRALARAKFPLRFSEGFNPKPRISFRGALPVGVEATAEPLIVELTHKIDIDEMMLNINETLPAGIEIVFAKGPVEDIRDALSKISDPIYTISLNDKISLNGSGITIESEVSSITAFLKKDEVWYEYIGEKKDKSINVRQYVEDVEILENGEGFRLKMKKINGSSPSPFKTISMIFEIPEEEARSFLVVKEGEFPQKP